MGRDEAFWKAVAVLQLTRREKELAGLVAQGLTNGEIAARLFISERTADRHLENIRTKLGFNSRSQIAAWAARQETPSPNATPPGRSMPAPVSSFVGRSREIREVHNLVKGNRLVTLLGPGGIGKTRLALATAQGLPGFRVSMVDLATADNSRRVLWALAEALEVGAAADMWGAVQAALQQGRYLVVLDCCEHVVVEAAELAERLLQLPGITVLATSREPLSLASERIFHVPSLAAHEAMLLFRERSQDETADDALVAEICRRLDNVPLAVELAAARTRVMSVAAIASGLNSALALLSAGSRTAPARQQSLTASIAWSHDELGSAERMCFRRLAVFPGAFGLALASRVAGVPETVVLALVERSLVARTGGDAYRLLDTVRQFAAERLSESDEVEQTRERLVVAYSELVESAAEDVKEVRLGMSAIFRELDSVRLVVDRLEATDSARFVRVAALSCPALYYRGRYREGLDLARRAARAPTDSSADRALANLYLAPLANMTGHHDEAAAAAAAALEAFEREGDIDWMIEALGMSAVSETRLGNVSLARTRLERAASLGEEGGRVPISRTLNLLACNEIVAGEFEAAEAFARRAVAALPEGKSLLGPAAASVTLAVALAGQGRFLEALPFSRQALRMELEGRGAQPDTDILRTPVVIELGLSHLERAATLAAAVEAIDEEACTPGTAFPILADGVEEALAFTVPEARLAFERGRQMSYLQAVRFASGDPE